MNKIIIINYLLSLLLGTKVYAAAPTKFDVTISWAPVLHDVAGRPVNGLKNYRVYLSTQSLAPCASPTPSSSQVLYFSTTTTETTKTVSLSPGSYYAVVTAVNAIGESVRSDQINFVVPTSAPDKPKIIYVNFKVP